MKQYLVDTNIFLRFLTSDDEQLAEKIERVFEDCRSGKLRLVTTVMVVSELEWTLRSYYGLTRKDVSERLEAVVSLPGLRVVTGVHDVVGAIEMYGNKNVDWVDILNYQVAKKLGVKILSYDRDFDKLEEGVRVEVE